MRAGSHLRVDGISFSFAGRRVLGGVSFTVSTGERLALIGENGSGKSTLLRLIAGLLVPAAGRIAVPVGDGVRPPIGLLHQEPPFGPAQSVTEAVEQAVAPLRRAAAAVGECAAALARSPEEAAVANAYARALQTAERLSVWELDARIETTLAGLGLGALDRGRATGSLSGGQRARLSLALLLLGSPEALLLDEPTNHLDDEATGYLLNTITAWNGPVLMATHDRAFLDEAATSLLDLDPSPLPRALAAELGATGAGSGVGTVRFSGGYRDYLAARADAEQRWRRRYREEQAELSRLRAAVVERRSVGRPERGPRSEARTAKKFYADRNARLVSRRVGEARSRLESLAARQIRRPPEPLVFRGLEVAGPPGGQRVEGPVLLADGVAVRHRLPRTSLRIERGEKWLVTGPNGSGKSTLLQLFAGRAAPDAGRLERAPGLATGLLGQESEALDRQARDRTAREAYAELVGAERAEEVPLGAFGLLAPSEHERPLAELSLGQRRRLELAALLARPPQLLLLDEPDNHFSPGLVAALEAAIADSPGTVVIASHDRWLRTHWTGRRLELPGRGDEGGGADGT
ncbi:MAG: ABC-F family ATP-binding cassette domain-containing protein [Pseudoclavibacter sp.]|nr:ABC-F family ATP-binding cassette domain-containing protein [Pseudoclavibacter sp.]